MMLNAILLTAQVCFADPFSPIETVQDCIDAHGFEGFNAVEQFETISCDTDSSCYLAAYTLLVTWTRGHCEGDNLVYRCRP